jgi:ferredoxin
MIEASRHKLSDTSNSKKATKSRVSRREFLLGMVGNRSQPNNAPTVLGSLAGEAQESGLGYTDMVVADSCTLCNACVDSCPQTAIALNQGQGQGELVFMPGECTGCGDCARICPENSITLSKGDAPLTPSARTVYRDDMVRCTKCTAPYASTKMLKKIETTLQSDVERIRLCPTCRQDRIYDNIFGKTVTAPN